MVQAQQAGQWRYTISTDLQAIPADMRVNFPTIRFEACLDDEDFRSGRAFSIQPTPGSRERCRTMEFKRDGTRVSLRYDCDAGKTLSGEAQGEVKSKQFTIQMVSRYQPAVSGVAETRQTMQASYLGACPAR